MSGPQSLGNAERDRPPLIAMTASSTHQPKSRCSLSWSRTLFVRLCEIASASGNGKTTVARIAAEKMGVRFIELDALVHGPGWIETSAESLRAQLTPILAEHGWVIDGTYTHKLGDLVLCAADQIMWLDLLRREPSKAPAAEQAYSLRGAVGPSFTRLTCLRTGGSPASVRHSRRSTRSNDRTHARHPLAPKLSWVVDAHGDM